MSRESQMQDIAEELSDLFAKAIFVDGFEHRTISGFSLCVVQVHYIESGASVMKTIRQTVVYLRAAELDVPEFAMWPHFKGAVGKLFEVVGSMVDINFIESPVFSEEYHLFAWNEEAVRQLFSNHFLDDRDLYFVQ